MIEASHPAMAREALQFGWNAEALDARPEIAAERVSVPVGVSATHKALCILRNAPFDLWATLRWCDALPVAAAIIAAPIEGAQFRAGIRALHDRCAARQAATGKALAALASVGYGAGSCAHESAVGHTLESDHSSAAIGVEALRPWAVGTRSTAADAAIGLAVEIIAGTIRPRMPMRDIARGVTAHLDGIGLVAGPTSRFFRLKQYNDRRAELARRLRAGDATTPGALRMAMLARENGFAIGVERILAPRVKHAVPNTDSQ